MSVFDKMFEGSTAVIINGNSSNFPAYDSDDWKMYDFGVYTHSIDTLSETPQTCSFSNVRTLPPPNETVDLLSMASGNDGNDIELLDLTSYRSNNSFEPMQDDTMVFSITSCSPCPLDSGFWSTESNSTATEIPENDIYFNNTDNEIYQLVYQPVMQDPSVRMLHSPLDSSLWSPGSTSTASENNQSDYHDSISTTSENNQSDYYHKGFPISDQKRPIWKSISPDTIVEIVPSPLGSSAGSSNDTGIKTENHQIKYYHNFCSGSDHGDRKRPVCEPVSPNTMMGIEQPFSRFYPSTEESTGSKPKRKRVQNARQRQAANVRERKRMEGLTAAFDNLKARVPTFSYEQHLSRIETLRLATEYISFMTEILANKK